MRQHQVRRLAHLIENVALEDVEARMHIEAVRLDAHRERDLHGRAAADHRIGKDAPNKRPFRSSGSATTRENLAGNSRHFVFIFDRYEQTHPSGDCRNPQSQPDTPLPQALSLI